LVLILHILLLLQHIQQEMLAMLILLMAIYMYGLQQVHLGSMLEIFKDPQARQDQPERQALIAP
jgi:hypothetical protein